MEEGKASEVVHGFLSPRETICRALSEYKRKTKKRWKDIAQETGEFSDGGIKAETLARIAMAFDKPNHRNALRSLTWSQLHVLSLMLHIEIAQVNATSGDVKPSDVCYFDPMLNPGQLSQFLEIRKKHETHAVLLCGYATFLPCSLETPEFMREHHTAMHKNVFATTIKERDTLVAIYNRFGASSQARFASPDRTFIFRHLMYAKHLKEIARGIGIYKNFSAKVRRDCLSNLVRLLRNDDLKVEMKVAVKHVPSLDEYLEGADSWWVVDRRLAVWRTKWGSIYWAEDGRKLERVCEMLATFEDRAEMNTNEKVIVFLKNELAHCHQRK